MHCYVYRSSKKEGLYVYLADKEALETLPEPVLKQLGQPELALEFELDENRKMGQEDPRQVMENLLEQGFHLQMPRDIETILQSVGTLSNEP